MKRLILVLIIAGLTASCGHPLSSLRSDLERRNALSAEYVLPTADTPQCAAGMVRMEKAATALQVSVTYGDAEGRFGFANWTEHTILIDQGATSCGRLEVLSHELAHFLQPKGLSAPEAQMFCDGVSYLVVRALGGYDPKTRYAVFLATYKPSGRVLTVLEREIEAVAAMLVSGTVSGVDLR
jgi:hypothetical protein